MFNAYISLVAILCEPLTICLANIPFKPGTAFIAYTVATWLSTVILALMLIGIVWKLSRKGVADSIHRPDTIAGVLVRLCGSHMLYEFSGMAQLTKSARNRAVGTWGKRYSMGRLIGVDGLERIGVDEDIFFPRE